MLNKRTNLLFDKDLWRILVALAQEENTSVGDLVRKAVRHVYVERRGDERRKSACLKILAVRKRQSGIDYKALINYGRRHL